MQGATSELLRVVASGGSAAMATVVRTWWSAPAEAGTSMIVTSAGQVIGSVSGGCVEGALVDVAQQVLADGRPRYETYGVSDDDAFAVGLSCGGILEVFVERVDGDSWPELAGIATSIARGEPVAVATMVRGRADVGRHLVVRRDRAEGTLGSGDVDDIVRETALSMLASGATGVQGVGPEGMPLDVLVVSHAPAPAMFVLGAGDLSAALVRVGASLGFRVTVVDARPVFANPERFPEAAEVVVDWPHRWLEQQTIDERTVIAVLTHDPKFDVPALCVALTSAAGYVGALGSRRTHEDRLERLREAGLAEEDLCRLHSPIGLDLGARTPEETAISIAAEIIRQHRGGTALSLRDGEGPIHGNAPD